VLLRIAVSKMSRARSISGFEIVSGGDPEEAARKVGARLARQVHRRSINGLRGHHAAR
jgi:hypothetical protein